MVQQNPIFEYVNMYTPERSVQVTPAAGAIVNGEPGFLGFTPDGTRVYGITRYVIRAIEPDEAKAWSGVKRFNEPIDAVRYNPNLTPEPDETEPISAAEIIAALEESLAENDEEAKE